MMKERKVRLTRYAVLFWKVCRGKGSGRDKCSTGKREEVGTHEETE